MFCEVSFTRKPKLSTILPQRRSGVKPMSIYFISIFLLKYFINLFSLWIRNIFVINFPYILIRSKYEIISRDDNSHQINIFIMFEKTLLYILEKNYSCAKLYRFSRWRRGKKIFFLQFFYRIFLPYSLLEKIYISHVFVSRKASVNGRTFYDFFSARPFDKDYFERQISKFVRWKTKNIYLKN